MVNSAQLPDRMLAIKSRKMPENKFPKIYTFLYIPSSYANIWGETKFQPQEFPQSGLRTQAAWTKSSLQDRLLIY